MPIERMEKYPSDLQALSGQFGRTLIWIQIVFGTLTIISQIGVFVFIFFDLVWIFPQISCLMGGGVFVGSIQIVGAYFTILVLEDAQKYYWSHISVIVLSNIVTTVGYLIISYFGLIVFPYLEPKTGMSSQWVMGFLVQMLCCSIVSIPIGVFLTFVLGGGPLCISTIMSNKQISRRSETNRDESESGVIEKCNLTRNLVAYFQLEQKNEEKKLELL